MRILRTRTIVVLAAFLLGPSVTGVLGATTSKKYVFKPGVTLEIGADMGDGVRLDTVQFDLPDGSGGRMRLSGVPRADVSIANGGPEPIRVGIAIAVFDADGNLVAVGSSGSKLLSIKSQRVSYYTLSFDHVNNRIHEGATFQITVETK